MKSLAVAVAFLFMFAGLSFGQCPSVAMSAPSSDVMAGTPVTYSVNVSGGDPYVTPTYNWTISAGTITRGQGTSTVSADSSGLAGQTMTATVDVGGFARQCLAGASATVSIKGKPVPSVKVDEFGAIDDKASRPRMDKMAARLLAEPGSTLYIIFYDGRKHTPGDAEAASLVAFEYIKNTKKVPNDVLTGHGGYRENLSLEFFFAAPNADQPMATPTLKETETTKLPAKPAKKN